MVTHVDSEKLLEHVAVVVILLRCLVEVGYFDPREKMESELSHFADERRDPLVFFADLLMQFRLALISNNHSVSGLPTFTLELFCLLTLMTDTFFPEITSIGNNVTRKPFALGVFPTAASLLNHSCDPNSATVYLRRKTRTSDDEDEADARGGSVQVTFATRVIRRGEEICHIYQGHFGDTELDARSAILRDMFREFDSIDALNNIQQVTMLGEIFTAHEIKFN